jgi:predicted transcriptional regulator
MPRIIKAELESIILKLIAEKNEISLQDVALVSGLSKSNEGDRKAIRRVLNSLIEHGFLEAKGAARGRIYTSPISAQKIENLQSAPEIAEEFRGISLSKKSESLLKYISQPIQARTPVGYNQHFLESYAPNETFYLSEPDRLGLLQFGRVENRVQPAGTYARHIFNRLLIDLSWNSSRLEGNTYSLLETKRLIELGENAEGKDITEAQMILNHKGAIEYIIDSAADEKISSNEICSIHAILSENLLGDPGASGRIREIAVGVGGSTYLPLDNPHVLKDCFQIFLEKLNLIENPFEQSFFSLVHLSYMQAFEDVNKRTARLAANISLIKNNLNPLSFTDVDKKAYVKSLLGIYEKNDISLLHDLYIWAYKRSSQRYSAIQQSMGEPNILKLKYRNVIKDIIRSIILDKVVGEQVVGKIRNLIARQNLPLEDADEIFKLIETEILSLHEGNVARFRIRPQEFLQWQKLQGRRN